MLRGKPVVLASGPADGVRPEHIVAAAGMIGAHVREATGDVAAHTLEVTPPSALNDPDSWWSGHGWQADFAALPRLRVRFAPGAANTEATVTVTLDPPSRVQVLMAVLVAMAGVWGLVFSLGHLNVQRGRLLPVVFGVMVVLAIVFLIHLWSSGQREEALLCGIWGYATFLATKGEHASANGAADAAALLAGPPTNWSPTAAQQGWRARLEHIAKHPPDTVLLHLRQRSVRVHIDGGGTGVHVVAVHGALPDVGEASGVPRVRLLVHGDAGSTTAELRISGLGDLLARFLGFPTLLAVAGIYCFTNVSGPAERVSCAVLVAVAAAMITYGALLARRLNRERLFLRTTWEQLCAGA